MQYGWYIKNLTAAWKHGLHLIFIWDKLTYSPSVEK